MHGRVDAWMHGCADARVDRYKDAQREAQRNTNTNTTTTTNNNNNNNDNDDNIIIINTNSNTFSAAIRRWSAEARLAG